MESVFLLVVIALTSAVGIWSRARRRTDAWTALGRSCGLALECLGCGLLCYLLNVAVAAALVLGVRNLSGLFLSLYLCTDTALLVLSLLQGLVAWIWIGRVQLLKS